MNIDTMRRIDAWVGVPACFFLTVIDKLISIFHTGRPGPIRKILFVKPAEQGATVLAYPAIIKAIEKVGRENIYFVVFENNRHILDVMDVVPEGNIITVPTHGLFKTLTGFICAILRIRKEKIDTVLDFEFFARVSAIICYLSGAKRRIGLHTYTGAAAYRGNLMTYPILYNSHIHTIDTYRILFEAIDAPVQKLPALSLQGKYEQAYDLPKLQPGPNDIREVEELLNRKFGQGKIGPVIILNANASDLLPLRCWARGNYIELARLLLDKYPQAKIVFTGAPDEAGPAEQIVSQVKSDRCVSLAGETSFRQLMSLYTIAKVLVTNDSGPAHFASMTSIRTIVLFGPETPLLFAPKSPGTHTIAAGLACSPCVSALNGRHTKCRDNICMQAITAEHVFAQTCKAYESSLTSACSCNSWP
ncbi:MAG: glycosyltransferase family 9 protein [Candidatus Brocadiia bacterium]|nr:MAG: glycosyltransferase family 9 protein [Candidatus Brocadiia bacterium]